MITEVTVRGVELSDLTIVNILSGSSATRFQELVTSLAFDCGLCIVDEFDQYRHWSEFKGACEDVDKLIEKYGQVFIPIYSLDALHALADWYYECLDKLSMHRLEFDMDDKVVVRDFSGKVLFNALKMGLEVR